MRTLLRYSLASHFLSLPFAVCGVSAETASLRFETAGPAGPILSEAFADPSAIADARGEFLELGNPRADSLRMDSLRISADGQSLTLTGLVMEPGCHYLICRDSLSASNGGMECRKGWPGLSLANSRETGISLEWSGGSAEYVLPAPRPGASWENTWEAAEGYRRFLPSLSPWGQGEMATPGFRNGRNAGKPARDLALADLAWVRSGSGEGGAEGAGTEDGMGYPEGYLSLRVENRGSEIPVGFSLALRLDSDWDGEAETPLDSLHPEMPASGTALFRFRLRPGFRGLVHASLGRDENPSNDAAHLPVEDFGPLAFTEWRPAPAGGEPEWVEIRNRTADSGASGRSLDLAGASFNGRPLGTKAGRLEPGEFLILTESLPAFRDRFGALMARAIEPEAWPSLPNAGGALVLALRGFAVDSVSYGGGTGSAEDRGTGAGATPGYQAGMPEKSGWRLSGKVAAPGRPLDVEVFAKGPGSYSLGVFDLEGNRVKDLGGRGPGRHRHVWEGEGGGGVSVAPGPYVLCLSMDGEGRRWRAVVLADGK